MQQVWLEGWKFWDMENKGLLSGDNNLAAERTACFVMSEGHLIKVPPPLGLLEESVMLFCSLLSFPL